MAPNAESRDFEGEPFEKLVAPQASPIKYELTYLNIAMFSYFHLAGAYGLYLAFTEAKWPTILLAVILHEAAIVGVTAGAHRLWAHRTYKANLPLQILLMLLHCFSCQYTAYHWARDHRLHHKFTDTDADPHNSTRGFFFSHIGWLLVKKHPEAKWYPLLFISTISFILPTLMPMYFWGETYRSAWHLTILRVIVSLHITFLVNSAAHAFGSKPYDSSITSTQSVSIALATLGEGYHNFHHAFPWDYRASEWGNNSLNFTTLFINFFAWLGWAYDLKAVKDDAVARKMERMGDGTNLWGWGDKDLSNEHERIVDVSFKKLE